MKLYLDADLLAIALRQRHYPQGRKIALFETGKRQFVRLKSGGMGTSWVPLSQGRLVSVSEPQTIGQIADELAKLDGYRA